MFALKNLARKELKQYSIKHLTLYISTANVFSNTM